MEVDNGKGGTLSVAGINRSATAQQVVTDARIDFSVDVKYHDHPYFDHGRGYFRVELDRMAGSRSSPKPRRSATTRPTVTGATLSSSR